MRYVEVLVEGFHDRAFIDGWLRHRGWRGPSATGRRSLRNPVTRKKVDGGRYGLTAPNNGTFVELVPARGDTNLLALAGERIHRAGPHDPDELIVVLDVDEEDHERGIERRRAALEQLLTRTDPATSRDGGAWTSSGVLVRQILWYCEDSRDLGAPRRNTLERVVSVAIRRAFEDRAEAVQRWLDERPSAPITSPKAYSWSYMAGWFADRGCEAFLSELWNEGPIARELDRLMAACGAKDTFELVESYRP